MTAFRRWIPALGLALFFLAPAISRAQVLVPTDPNVAPLAIKSQRVSVEIKDQLARTHVEQVFVSNSPTQLEATYVFPIPDDVAVSEFSMWMNGKKVQGEVLEADKARGIYESIVARMRDPGLLEYAGQKLLRARVYPIPPHGEQKIEVEYGEVTKIESGVGRYVYPLATGGKSTRVQDDLSLKVMIESKIPVKTVYSPTHKIDVEKKDDHTAVAGFEEKGAALDHDFDLFWAVSDKDVGVNLLTFKDAKGEDGYFVVMMAPRTEVTASDVLPKDVIFVLDTSGSMDGGKIKKAKEALRYVLGSLNAKDRFDIIRFSTGVEDYKNELVPAGKDEIDAAKKFVDGMEAQGGTAIDDALAEAMKMAREKQQTDRPQFIVFITDGEPTIGETDPQTILANADRRAPKGLRIFDFGVGTDLNAVLLDALANQHGGAPEYATEDEDIEAKISDFASKVNNPIMTDLAVDFGKTQVYDVYPKQVPDLFKGGQVTIFGRYKGGGAGAMTLTGTLQGKKQSFTYEGKYDDSTSDADDPNAFIPRLWATRKVGYLLDEIRLHGEKPELRDEVVELAKKWGIMTPYTSYLVAEDVPVASNFPPPPPPYRVGPALTPEPDDHARDEESRRGWFGSMSGGGAGNAPVAASAPKAAPARGYDADMMAPGEASTTVAQATGDTGVAVSKKVKEDREKDVLDSNDVSNVTRVGGHTFALKGGVWIDTDYKGTEKVTKVKYLSAAWFAIVHAHPELRDAMSVGERVVIVTSKGHALVVADDGATTMSDSDAKAL